MNILRNKNNVTNANAQLVNDKKSVGDKNSWGRDPTHNTWPLFKSELHALGVREKRSAVLFAQDVLRSHQDVKAVGADEADQSHVYESTQPATVVEGLVHG